MGTVGKMDVRNKGKIGWGRWNGCVKDRLISVLIQFSLVPKGAV